MLYVHFNLGFYLLVRFLTLFSLNQFFAQNFLNQ